MKKWLILLILFAFIFRIYSLGSQSLWIDEAFSINAIKAIHEHLYPLLDSGWVYDSYLLFHYLAAVPMSIWFSEAGARILSVIFGTMMVPLVFLFARDLFGRKAGFASAVLLAFYSLEIAWSRQARSYMMLQFFYVLSIYLFYHYISGKKYGVYVALSTIAAVGTHPLGYMLLPVYAVYGGYHVITNRIYPKKLLWLAPALVLFIAWKYKAIYGMLTTSSNYLWSYLSYFHNEHFLILYLGAIGIVLLQDFKKQLLLLLALLVPAYFVSFHEQLLHFRYLFLLVAILIILSSGSIAFLIDKVINAIQAISKKRSYAIAGSAIVAAIILISFARIDSLTFIPRAEYFLEPQTPQPDFKSAYIYVRENMDDDSVIVSSYPPMAMFYAGRVDYALEFSMSGVPNSSNRACPDCTTERYNNITLMDDSMLQKMTSEGNGFIIVDALSMRMIDDSVRSRIQGLNLSYSNAVDRYSQVYVYSWS